METVNFLNDLINSGSDAASNLYKVEIDGIAPSRIKKIDIPVTSRKTTALPYKNLDVLIPSNTANLVKKASMTIRVDSSFELFTNLKSKLDASDLGNCELNKASTSNITVYCYEPSPNDFSLLEVKRTYKFIQCKIISITSGNLSFSYEGSNPLEAIVTFIYKNLEVS